MVPILVGGTTDHYSSTLVSKSSIINIWPVGQLIRSLFGFVVNDGEDSHGMRFCIENMFVQLYEKGNSMG